MPKIIQARIVLGANYGDEGKGTIVAKYSKEDGEVLNILTNGGAQRGHTVVTNDTVHTFHHFGSGTLSGAATYCSRFFILNPMEFRKEWDSLVIKPKVFRDTRCKWTVPFDMIANTITEQLKGTHGSCRMGVWNTILRNKEMNFISFDDFNSLPYSGKLVILEDIKKWYERRIPVPDEWKGIWNSPFLITNFMDDCTFMLQNTIPAYGTKDEFVKYDGIIFENGQGLLLTDRGKDTYDTTPSNTGVHDALCVLKESGLDKYTLTAHYVTRPYLTRHGDGLLKDETSMKTISSYISEDRCNNYNEGQGDFRYGKLDVKELKRRIEGDAENLNYKVELTHCDEMDRTDEFKKTFGNIGITDSPVV